MIAALWKRVCGRAETPAIEVPIRIVRPRDAIQSFRDSAARYPDLLPTDSSLAAFSAWLAKIGQSDQSPDELADLYADVCELVELARPEPIEPTHSLTLIREALDINDAASRFVDWLHENRLYGSYRPGQFEDLYLRHTSEIGHAPCKFHSIKGLLEPSHGIRQGFTTVGYKDKSESLARERRIRQRAWIVEPAPPPFDLPERVPTESPEPFRMAA